MKNIPKKKIAILYWSKTIRRKAQIVFFYRIFWESVAKESGCYLEKLLALLVNH